jgi:uncharacterized protein YdeI (YjbR/CyaY-like superfamily)
MSNRNPAFDAYIAKSAEFARPILERIRKLYHQGCPEIQETMKWSFPHFEYKGIVGSMAAFKQHVGFGFWKAQLMKDPHKLLTRMGDTSMGSTKVQDISELPADKVLLDYIREAVALNEQGAKVVMKKQKKGELVIPDYFMAAIKKNKKAIVTFEAFSTSHKREYVEWVVESKQEATRDKRLGQAVEWMAEGKSRHWKYAKG